jgi:hypothetical protein
MYVQGCECNYLERARERGERNLSQYVLTEVQMCACLGTVCQLEHGAHYAYASNDKTKNGVTSYQMVCSTKYGFEDSLLLTFRTTAFQSSFPANTFKNLQAGGQCMSNK